MKNNFLVQLSSALLIILWLYTAVTKFADPGTFRFALEKSNWLRPFSDILIWLIPSLELALTVGLIIPLTKKLSLLCSAALLSAFTIYLAAIIVFKQHLPCACGGVITQMGWQLHIIFNVVFIVIALIGYYASQSRPKLLLQ